MPHLIDGREVASSSPEWLIECLAKHVLAIKPLARRQAWLADYAKGKAASALQDLQNSMAAVHAAKKKA